MCPALKELLKEEIQEEIDKATAATRAALADKDEKLKDSQAELKNSRAESAQRALDMDALRAQLRAAGLKPVV